MTPKTLILTLLLLTAPVVVDRCDRKKPQPIPTPSATPTPVVSPTVEPTPTPTPRPVAFPTPVVDLSPWLKEQGGRVVEVDTTGAEDVGKLVNAADSFDGPGKIVIKGGGNIHTQTVLTHDSEWYGEYYCETKTLTGSILMGNGTKHEGKGAVIYGPTFNPGAPAITVFQTIAPAFNNYAGAFGVTVKGFRIVGRQNKTDGGVRQVISFGNCIECAAIENILEWSPSIGIQFGGGAAEGRHAERVVAYRNKLTNFAAAAIALVNVKGAIVAENDMRNPGRKDGEPGGISAVDIESNNVDDCVKDLKIFNNYIGYGNSAFFSAGNGILGQNVYDTPCSGGLLIANNVIDGWEGRNGTEASTRWGLSGGLYFVGQWREGVVASNVVIRALQPAVSMYMVRGLTIQDTWLVSSGGGGAGAIFMQGSSNNTFLRVRIFDDPNIFPGSTGHWVDCDKTSVDNVFKETNISGGVVCLR